LPLSASRNKAVTQRSQQKNDILHHAPMHLRRWALLTGLAGFAALFWASGGLDHISLAELSSHQTTLDRFVAHWPILAVGIYILAFGLLTGACLPVALTLTLAGGVLLGPLVGGGATVLGATLGATLTYLAARSTLGAWMAKRLRRAPKLDDFLQRAREHPFPLMLFARLMPLFPFAPVNIAASLAGIPLRPYVLATLLGAIPSSFIYSSVGAGLEQTLSEPAASVPEALSSPAIAWPLAGLALLSLLSLALRPLVARLRATS
jgi:uncharacterized membrane protein YdjX (TVP38/TMEM64 family)